MTDKEFEAQCYKIREVAEDIIKQKENLDLSLGEVFEFIEMNSEYTVEKLKEYYGIEEEEGEE